MEKVSAFCHFQQLMGAWQCVGPIVDDLRIDHFVGFRLDHAEFALLRQGVIAQAHHRRGDHEQVLEGNALGFQATTEAGCDEAAEREAHQGQWQLRVLFPQPAHRRLGVVHLAAAHVMAAGTLANAAVVETQGNVAGIAGGALQHRHHLVHHGATLHRVGVAQQHNAAGVGDIEVQGFQLADRAIDEYGGFADKQG
ncbi:hypothetical protein D3C80_958660 [compost metagenome]